MDRDRGTQLNLRDLPGVLRRRWALFLGVAGGVVAAVMLVTLLIPPQYETESSVRVRTDRMSGMAGRLAASGIEDALPMASALPLSDLGGDVQTEIGVLGSRRILEAVADSLALHVSLSRPRREFRTEVLEVLDGAGEEAPRGVYTLRREGDGTYSVSASGTREEVELPERVRIGEPFRIGPMAFRLVPELEEDPPRVVRFHVRPFRRMITRLRRDVKIEREDMGSRLVAVRYRHTDPHLAKAFVNGTVERFMDYSLSEAVSDSRREARILEDQVARYAEQLEEVEDRLRAYQEQERLVVPEEQAIAQVERIAELQVERDIVAVERQALAGLLREVGEVAGTELAGPAFRRLATFPSFIGNEAVQQLLSTLTALENERSQLLVRRTEANIDVRRVDERIREIERQLYTLASDYLQSLDLHLASSRAALDEFEAELELMPGVELEYTRLVRDRRMLTEIYLILQGRLTEARVQEAIDDARVRIVDTGVIEDRPAFPRPAIIFVLSVVLGMMTATFTVVAAETTSPFVRTRRELEEAGDGPLLGAVPLMAGARRRGRKAERAELVTRSDPWSPGAESFRALALSILSADPAPRTIVVAGHEAGAGRTTVAANLAAALAEQGLRVALVDGDLRSGNLHEVFREAREPGWPALAVAGGPARDAGRRVELRDGGASLMLFPAGVASAHPLEVLSSTKVARFLTGLAEAHDVVVIDTPPLEEGHDAAVLGGIADGVVLVAREGRTRKDRLAEAAQTVARSRGKVLGTVLNGTDGGRGRKGRLRSRKG